MVRCCREAYPLVASGEPDVPKYGDTGGDGAGGPAEAYPRCVDRGAGYEWLGVARGFAAVAGRVNRA